MIVDVKLRKYSPSIVGMVLKLLWERSIDCNCLFAENKFWSVPLMKLFDKLIRIKFEPKQASSDVLKIPVIALNDRSSIAIFG